MFDAILKRPAYCGGPALCAWPGRVGVNDLASRPTVRMVCRGGVTDLAVGSRDRVGVRDRFGDIGLISPFYKKAHLLAENSATN